MTEVKRGMEEAQRYLDVADALVKKSLVWIKGSNVQAAKACLERQAR
jgi:hypothetical protein